MNALDVLIGVAAVVALLGGWRMGFLTRAFGWVGAGLGLLVALAAVPRLISTLELESRPLIAGVSVLATLALVTLGQGIGASLGGRVRPSSGERGARTVEPLAGAALGARPPKGAVRTAGPVASDEALADASRGDADPTLEGEDGESDEAVEPAGARRRRRRRRRPGPRPADAGAASDA